MTYRQRVFTVDPGADRTLATGDDAVTSFDTSATGNLDPEGHHRAIRGAGGSMSTASTPRRRVHRRRRARRPAGRLPAGVVYLEAIVYPDRGTPLVLGRTPVLAGSRPPVRAPDRRHSAIRPRHRPGSLRTRLGRQRRAEPTSSIAASQTPGRGRLTAGCTSPASVATPGSACRGVGAGGRRPRGRAPGGGDVARRGLRRRPADLAAASLRSRGCRSSGPGLRDLSSSRRTGRDGC